MIANKDDLLKLVADLSARLCVMHEMCYLPEDVEFIDPDGIDALRRAQTLLNDQGGEAPTEMIYWVNKVNGFRTN